MISANELRLGNYVLVADKPTKVEGIDNQGINSSVSGGYYPGETEIEYEAYFEDWGKFSTVNHAMPIPLTEELLVKCGAKYNKIKGVVTLGEDSNDEEDTEFWDFDKLTIVRWGGREFTLSNAFSFDLRVTLTSLHQLQNLYFALVGKELEITL